MSRHEMDTFEQIIVLRQRRDNALARLAQAQARIAQVEARLQDVGSQRTYPSERQSTRQNLPAVPPEAVLPASGDLELQASFASGRTDEQGSTDRMRRLQMRDVAFGGERETPVAEEQ